MRVGAVGTQRRAALERWSLGSLFRELYGDNFTGKIPQHLEKKKKNRT
jgi:hypothetical protein